MDQKCSPSNFQTVLQRWFSNQFYLLFTTKWAVINYFSFAYELQVHYNWVELPSKLWWPLLIKSNQTLPLFDFPENDTQGQILRWGLNECFSCFLFYIFYRQSFWWESFMLSPAQLVGFTLAKKHKMIPYTHSNNKVDFFTLKLSQTPFVFMRSSFRKKIACVSVKNLYCKQHTWWWKDDQICETLEGG